MNSRGGVGKSDSVEKVVHQLGMLTPETVTYQGKVVGAEVVNEVILSPSLFRKFTCAPDCTACCLKFTLDYIPSELHFIPEDQWAKWNKSFETRTVDVNGIKRNVYTSDQNDNPVCDFLTKEREEGGLGCALWPWSPLSCASAPQLQFIQMRPGKTYVLKKPFGRAWRMDPEPQCEFEQSDPSEWNLAGDLSLIERFIDWSNYFSVDNTALTLLYNSIAAIHTGKAKPPTTQGQVVWSHA